MDLKIGIEIYYMILLYITKLYLQLVCIIYTNRVFDTVCKFSGNIMLSYKKTLFLCLICSLLLTFQATSISATSEQSTDEEISILVLHSYYPTYEWSNEISAGIADVLKDSDYSDAEVYFEFMDAKRHFSPEYMASLGEVYRLRYNDPYEFDLIVVSDNHAIDFLASETGLEIFPADMPVVFCGANDYDPTWLENRPNMTGVVESIQPGNTLEHILMVHPETKNLLVLSDSRTHTSHIVTEQTKQEFAPYEDQLNIQYLEDMTVTRMNETVSNVSDDTVIFLLLYNRDSTGKEVTMTESIQLIAESSKVPVYSSWKFYLGKGIVGGKLTSAYNEGKHAGEIAIRVMDGANPADIPVTTSKYHEFMFDWEQMQLFSISEDDLPDGSIIVNKELAFSDQYRTEINIAFVVMLALVSMVVLLMMNRRNLYNTQMELLEAKKNAERADHLKSAFLANISHELRTPLNGIIGFAQMLKLPTLSAEKKEQYADIIVTSGNRLLNLINDVLDISKIEAGEINIYRNSFNFNYLLDEMYSIFQVQLESKKPPIELNLNKSLDDDESIMVSDRDRMSQILTNLLGNAVKFTHEGSVTFGYDLLDNNTLQFYVKDTGIGIPEENFSSIFARFQQVDDSHSRRYKGTGLGMSISKGLAQLLGGDLIFESEYGVGSTFYFTIPYVQDTDEN